MKHFFFSLALLFSITSYAQQCIYNGTAYSAGAVVCMSGWEYQCNGSTWEYLGHQCGNVLTQSKTEALIKGDSQIEKLDYTTDTKAKLLPCTSFFSTGSTAEFGIRNNCAECKVAVVSWAGVGMRYYRLGGYSSIVVPILSYSGQLVGEQPCQ